MFKQEFQTRGNDITSIGMLCRQTGLPHRIGNKLIGKIEAETDDNVKVFREWLVEHDNKILLTYKDYKRIGGTKYGYTYNLQNEIVPNPHEQTAIKLIIDLREKGLTFLKIAAKLNKGSMMYRNDKPWTYNTTKGVYGRNTRKDI